MPIFSSQFHYNNKLKWSVVKYDSGYFVISIVREIEYYKILLRQQSLKTKSVVYDYCYHVI